MKSTTKSISERGTYPQFTLTLTPSPKKDAQFYQIVVYPKHKKKGSFKPWEVYSKILIQNSDKCEAEIDFSDNKQFCGYQCVFRAISVNNYATTRTELESLVPLFTEYFTYYCWNSEAKIHMYDGSLKEVQNVQIGDILLSASGAPTTVKRIKETHINGPYKMVQLGDFWISRGHPIYVNNEWYRPDEIYPLSEVFIDTLYNFYAEPEHFLVVGEEEPFTCSSLGGYCPRPAAMDPINDILYGRGYGSKQAESYRWLLSLKERIPDDQVVPKVPSEYVDLFPGREDLVVQ